MMPPPNRKCSDMSRRRWQPHHDAVILAEYRTTGAPEIARRFGATPAAIRNRARRLGLHRPQHETRPGAPIWELI